MHAVSVREGWKNDAYAPRAHKSRFFYESGERVLALGTKLRPLGELGVVLFGAIPIPPQIHSLGFTQKFLQQRWWQWDALVVAHNEISGGIVPGQLSIGQADQQRVDGLVFDPVANLLVYPLGGSGFR